MSRENVNPIVDICISLLNGDVPGGIRKIIQVHLYVSFKRPKE